MSFIAGDYDHWTRLAVKTVPPNFLETIKEKYYVPGEISKNITNNHNNNKDIKHLYLK